MTLEQFFNTTRGIDNGKNIDPTLLESLYVVCWRALPICWTFSQEFSYLAMPTSQSIRDNEIKMDQDSDPSAFDNADKEGFLKKRGGRLVPLSIKTCH